MLLISIGSPAVAISVYLLLGATNVAEYVALFTSVSTAVYAILAEPRERTEPILRITPLLKRYGKVVVDGLGNEGKLGIDIWTENIGYSVAKDIEVDCRFVPDGSIRLKDNGIFKHSLLAPREIIQYQAVDFADADKLLAQQLIIESSYLNEDDEKQKPMKKVCAVKELKEGLRETKT